MMRTQTWITVVGIALGASTGCAKPEEAPKPQPPRAAPADAAATAPVAAVAVKPAFVEVTGFSTPESVLVLTEPDVYLVSSINGPPAARDDNGFISKLGPDGKVVELKWIDGASDKVTLNAPKGMAVRGGVLYVADIDVVRKFDLATGAPKGEVKIKGMFLNDVAVAGDVVYVTDTGVDAAFKPTGKDAVYAIDASDKPKALIAAKDLGGPNGVTVIDGKVWVVLFGGKALFRVEGGKQVDAQELPGGQLDGLQALGDGRVAVSSWETKTVYAGKLGGPFTPLLEGIEAPADLGVDLARKVVAVPLFQGNVVRLYPY